MNLLQRSVFLIILFLAQGSLCAQPVWIYDHGGFSGQREAQVSLGLESDSTFGNAQDYPSAFGQSAAQLGPPSVSGYATVAVKHSADSTILNEDRTVRLTALGEVTAYASRGLTDSSVSIGPNTYASMGTIEPGLTDTLFFRLVEENGNDPPQEFQISVTSWFHMNFGYTVSHYHHLSWHSSEPSGGFSGNLGAAGPEQPFQILLNDDVVWDARDYIGVDTENRIVTSGLIHSDYRFSAQAGDVIGIRAEVGVGLESGAALLTSHTWLSRGLFELEMSILDETGQFPEPDPPAPGSTIAVALQPDPDSVDWPRVFTLYIDPVTTENAGLGVVAALWFDPEPSEGFKYEALGLNMTSITLPGPSVGHDAIGDNLFDLWLINPETDEFEHTVTIFGGVPYDLTELHEEGVGTLLISGIEDFSERQELGAFYTGLTFTDPGNDSVEVQLFIDRMQEDTPPLAQVTLTATGDSTLRALARNRNEGVNPRLRVTAIGRNRAIVAFDPDEIAAFGELTNATATLVLTVAENPNYWGSNGRAVDASPLIVEFPEGNGQGAALPFRERTRGNGLGVTWNCATDAEISNFRRDCSDPWYGGLFDAPTAASVIHTNELSDADEVSWDVTADARAGASSWVIKKANELKSGYVHYYSKEGAVADVNLAPQLILER